MDHLQVLRRAWDILWSYRALWIFGIVLALTTASAGTEFTSTSTGGGSSDWPTDSEMESIEIPPEIEAWVDQVGVEQLIQAAVGIGITLACIVIVLVVVFSIARFVAETSLIKMVDRYEETGEPLSIRQGLRLGWSREAWRIFLVELLTALPVMALVIIPAVSFVVMIVSLSMQGDLIVPAIVAGVLGFLLFVLIAVIAGVVLTLLKQFVWREVVLNEQPVGPAFRTGYTLVKAHLKDVGLMWLVLVGVNIVWQIALVPVTIIVVLVGIIVALLIFLMVGSVSGVFAPVGVNWLIGGVTAVLVFIPLVIFALVIVQGFFEVYVSSVWTLTYRELNALNGRNVEPLV
ncbi:MAG: hypothetical protein GYB64_15545 [Chloroflexi bacterium]|nr:hypothetical protein [Chloroflexota bacterium]